MRERKIKQELSHEDVILKYSKSSDFYLQTKKDFFSENDSLLLESVKQNQLYASQPKRESCKICENTLPDTTDFNSHGVDYVFCGECNHLRCRLRWRLFCICCFAKKFNCTWH